MKFPAPFVLAMLVALLTVLGLARLSLGRWRLVLAMLVALLAVLGLARLRLGRRRSNPLGFFWWLRGLTLGDALLSGMGYQSLEIGLMLLRHDPSHPLARD